MGLEIHKQGQDSLCITCVRKKRGRDTIMSFGSTPNLRVY